ncbi:hypothetical protein Leryth_024047 [Lithospermum erythrorhizon]|nr:hypothetical protein Leryth_024047 [Lithospermum erythrorhizon]
MGACGSTPSGCVKVGGGLRTYRKPKRGAKCQSFSQKNNKIEPFASLDRSYSNPTFQQTATNVESWFDTVTGMDSDCDDDFYSVLDDVSQIGSGALSTVVTPRFSEHRNCNGSLFMKLTERSFGNLESNIGQEISADGQMQCACLDGNCRTETGTPHSCGFGHNACLPCGEEKSKHLSPRSPSTRRKASVKISITWREAQGSSMLLSPRGFLQRPIAGSQVPCSPVEKSMPDSWSRIDPNTFRVRGQNYFRDKKKELAANFAAFYPFGVDVFLSPRKIDHIARFVELPAVDSIGDILPILVVNVQMPLYPTAIFENEYDGEGMNLVFYFKLSDKYSKELPVNFQENIRKLINDEVEKVRGFPVDTHPNFRERLKILGRVANVEDLRLSPTERKLINTYNEKPVLSRPQHQFYLGENYLEIDLDMHRFSYIARKGFEAFQEKLKDCVLDFGLTIQGNKAEDLPEQMLCCIRLKELNYANFDRLGF